MQLTKIESIPLVKVGLPDPDKLMPRIQDVLYSGMIAEGEDVYNFEDKFKSHYNIKNGLAMSSGTAALHAALFLSKIVNGDEVITTSMTAEPTNLAILQSGAVPVFADVDIKSGNISPESIEQKITSRTRAIVVVHYAGFPVRLKEISEIAKRHGLVLIEDCAHALGAKYNNQYVGISSDFAIYSFQAIKHMTTVDGGFLVIKNEQLLRKAKKFRWFGLEKGVDRTKSDITFLGHKYNMHNVTAAIGLVQLDYIDDRIDKHIGNGKYFDNELSKIPGLEITEFDYCAEPSYWLYTVLSEDSSDVQRKLTEIGVMASKLHRPNHLHSIFSSYADELPNLDLFYKRMIHIPSGWWLTAEKREAIVMQLKKG